MGKGILIVVGLAGVTLVVLMLIEFSCQTWWQDQDKLACTAIAVIHEWQALSTGLLALIAAGGTIATMRRQMQQADDHRYRDRRERAASTAATIHIDLWGTSEMLRDASVTIDLIAPMSETARDMIPETTKFAPVLAAALHKHCIEIARLSMLRNVGEPVATLAPDFRRMLNSMAYRAYVLGHCFSTASLRLQRAGSAKGPYVSAEELQKFEDEFGVDTSDRGYLSNVFDHTGLG